MKKKQTGGAWEAMSPSEAMDAKKALEAVAVDEKVTYAIMHYGEFLYTTTSYDADNEWRLVRRLTNLTLELSGVYEGAFYLLSVERSENNGWEDYNLVAVARDGVEL